MARVSVIIPTYNFGRFIGAAIESARAQTLTPDEIIVIDDGSTDDTEDVVRGFDGVEYIRQENAGVCAARNRGVEASAGELVAFLDADDVWEPTKVEKQVAIFNKDPQVGLVHCGMREFAHETGETIAMHLNGADGWMADNLLLWDGPVIVGPGGTIMVRRDVYDEMGGFDTRQKVGEDWDLCYRIARKYKVGFVPEPLVNYRSHPGAAHHNVREMERGMGLFYKKAFADPDPHVQSLKGRSYSNYHRVLAGSYFASADYPSFLRHTLLSLRHQPSQIGYFLQFPLRRFSKR